MTDHETIMPPFAARTCGILPHEHRRFAALGADDVPRDPVVAVAGLLATARIATTEAR